MRVRRSQLCHVLIVIDKRGVTGLDDNLLIHNTTRREIPSNRAMNTISSVAQKPGPSTSMKNLEMKGSNVTLIKKSPNGMKTGPHQATPPCRDASL